MKSKIDARLLAALLAVLGSGTVAQTTVTVTAQAETASTDGDTDDPAIWVGPGDGAASRIIGTDKEFGLRVYALDGALLQEFPDGKLNNVDLRAFAGAGGVALVGATKREDDTLVFYTMSAEGVLSPATPFAFPGIPPGQGEADDIYGFAMQQDPATGRLFALANFKTGHVFQWEVTATDGQLALTFQRGLKVGTQPEGMVSDDAGGMIYVGEEDVGVWQFSGDPASGAAAVAVDTVGSPCLPIDDVEGLGIHEDGDKRYLVVSAQGIDKAAIYRLDPAALPVCVGLVGIGAGAVDGVSETDGLDVVSRPMPGYAEGLMVMMDDQNEGYTTNFKMISWADVRTALGL
jgi:3-phytase